MKFQTTLQVRGYEIDSYNHVNNAVYMSYYEQARWEILKELNLFEFVKKHNLFLVLVDARVRFLRELKNYDKFVIYTTITKESPYIIFHQKIHKLDTDEKISKATMKLALIRDKKIAWDFVDEIHKKVEEYQKKQ